MSTNRLLAMDNDSDQVQFPEIVAKKPFKRGDSILSRDSSPERKPFKRGDGSFSRDSSPERKPFKRGDSNFSRDSSQERGDPADNQLPGSRKGKFKAVQTEIRKATAVSKLLNRRVGLADRMASFEGIRDLATMQAIKSFGKIIFKDFSETEMDFLAGIESNSCPTMRLKKSFNRRAILCSNIEAWRHYISPRRGELTSSAQPDS
jgi:hypothetical protein